MVAVVLVVADYRYIKAKHSYFYLHRGGNVYLTFISLYVSLSVCLSVCLLATLCKTY